jgi:competence protein ComEC
LSKPSPEPSPLFELQTQIQANKPVFAPPPSGPDFSHGPEMEPIVLNAAFPLSLALVSGRLDALPEESSFLLARCGLLHIFTAAGVHLWVFRVISRKIGQGFSRTFSRDSKFRKWLPLALGLGAGISLGRLTDWSAPWLRAFLYCLLHDGATALELKTDRKWLFVLSLLAFPASGQSGMAFLFCAAAMAGQIFLTHKGWWSRILAPWLLSLPIAVWSTGLFPLLGPFWNLSFGMVLSWMALPLALLATLAQHTTLRRLGLLPFSESFLNKLLELLGALEQPLGLAYWVRPDFWAASVALLWLAWLLSRKKRHLAIALFFCALAFAFLLPRPSLAMLDVGQGDSFFFRNPRGEGLLFDMGPPSAKGGPAPAARALEKLAEDRLDQLLLSHLDLDHRGGLDSLLARHKVKGALWFREEDLALPAATKVLAAAERAALPIRFLSERSAPAGLRCWLSPLPKANDSCPLCLALLPSGKYILFTGDMSEKAEGWFLDELPAFPAAEYLKVAHHGSRSSTSADFLRAVHAHTALLSVGLHNRYHHPNPETLDRLKSAGLRVIRSDEEGSVLLESLPGSWARVRDYLAGIAFTEESMRVGGEPAPRENPGREESTRRL